MNFSTKELSKKLGAHPNVAIAYFFGSQAKGRPSKESDVDIAILLKNPVSDPLKLKLELLELLQEGIDDNVDMTILNDAGSVLKYQVVKNGKLIFERKKGDHKKFQFAKLCLFFKKRNQHFFNQYVF